MIQTAESILLLFERTEFSPEYLYSLGYVFSERGQIVWRTFESN